jgi:hypothetical protein
MLPANGTSTPPRSVTGPCGTYSVLASGHSSVVAAAERCDGTMGLVLFDQTGPSMFRLIDSTGTTLVEHPTDIHWTLVGTQDGFAAVTHPNGGSEDEVRLLDPLGNDMGGPPVAHAPTLPSQSLAADPSGTCATPDAMDRGLLVFPDSLSLGSSVQHNALSFAPDYVTTSNEGFAVWGTEREEDGGIPVASRYNVHWVGISGRESRLPSNIRTSDFRLAATTHADTIHLVALDSARNVVVQGFDHNTGEAREPVALGPADNRWESAPSLRIAEGPTRWFVAWANGYFYYPSDHDQVYAAILDLQGNAAPTLCVDRGATLDSAWGLRTTAGFAVVWNWNVPLQRVTEIRLRMIPDP